MSTISTKTLESLFVSKVRIKVLNYFVMNPNTSIHLRGAVREFEEEINAVRRELSRLEESEFITSESKGNRKYFKLNVEHPFYSELASIFHKSFGLGSEIVINVAKIGVIDFAFLTPHFTKNLPAQGQVVDLVFVGDLDLSFVEEMIKNYQYRTGREVHYMVMKSQEFIMRKRRRDQFVSDILMLDNTVLIGNPEDLLKL